MKDTSFNKRLLQLVLPITLQNFMFALVPVADAVMLVALDQDAMSAVSLATQVTFFLNLFIFAITSGASMFAAQFWGDQDLESMEKLYGFVMKITIPIVAVFFILNLDEIVKLPAVYKHYKKYRWVKNLAQAVSDSTDFS